MPYLIKKVATAPRKKRYSIVKKLRSGRTEVVGHSSTKAKAQTSARIRAAAEKAKR